jgi:phospholipid N-methyltransferase
MGKSASLAGYLHFFWAGVFKHSQTGSFFPSQKALVEAMIAPVPSGYNGLVLELGAGTGSLTVRLAERCPRAKIMACELNPILAEDTRRNLDRAGVNGQVQVRARSAQEVLAELKTRGGDQPGYVISALPLGNLPKNAVIEILQKISLALPENGVFVQAQHFLVNLKDVRSAFRSVRTVPILRNFPPLFVYYASNGPELRPVHLPQ